MQNEDRLSPPLPRPTPGSPPPNLRGHLADRPLSRRDAATLTDLRDQQAAPPRRRWGGTPVRFDRKPRRLQSHYYNSEEDLSYGEEEEEYEEVYEEEELEYLSRRRPRPREPVGYSGKRERRVHRHRPNRFELWAANTRLPVLNYFSCEICSTHYHKPNTVIDIKGWLAKWGNMDG